MMPSLMIDHLSINLRSGTDNLVSEISFAIKEGESLILLGQSGSGKTMTCSAVLNLLDPKKFKVSGSVFFGKTDLLNAARLNGAAHGHRAAATEDIDETAVVIRRHLVDDPQQLALATHPRNKAIQGTSPPSSGRES